MAPVDDQLAILMSGVDYGDEHLKKQMERELRGLLQQDRPLRVYLGVDPTATSLTLGHTVPLRKLRQFQQLGHHAIFLIGDYTALIGDPSDKNKLRPQLSQEDIKANERTYFDQASTILDPAKTELRHNSEWLGKLQFPDIISLMSKFTVAGMLRRDNFRKRWGRAEVEIDADKQTVRITSPSAVEARRERQDTDATTRHVTEYGTHGLTVRLPEAWKLGRPKLIPRDGIYLHEFLYALMQGYDAYALECDVQVGGTEQLFNLMAGRKIQEDAGQKPHVPVTLPILVGLDGKARMSKSAGNHIGVNDTADEQYGKTMSLPDGVIIDFFVLATNVARTELAAIQQEIERDPMAAKKRLARTIVSEFHGDDAADEAERGFEARVQRKEAPDEIPEFAIAGFPTLIDVLVSAGAAPSKREARRLFEQRAVTVDGAPVEGHIEPLRGMVIQVGKRRWLRLV